MFGATAQLYDDFYDALDKDYRWESRRVLELAHDVSGRRSKSVLDVACGTGRHLEVFARTCECAGVDIHDGMLGVAAARCPGVPLVQADMQRFALHREFDLVTCLFSSIAYNLTVAALRRSVRTMARHVRPGGVLAIEPWYEAAEWEVGHLAILSIDRPGVKAARVSRASRRRDISILDFDYLVADAEGTATYHERHELRLFAFDQYVEAVERAGMAVTVDDYGLFGRGLVLGLKDATDR